MWYKNRMWESRKQMGIFQKLKTSESPTKHYGDELWKFPSRVATTNKLLHWIIHIIDVGMGKHVCTTTFIAVYIMFIPQKMQHYSPVIYKKYIHICINKINGYSSRICWGTQHWQILCSLVQTVSGLLHLLVQAMQALSYLLVQTIQTVSHLLPLHHRGGTKQQMMHWIREQLSLSLPSTLWLLAGASDWG